VIYEPRHLDWPNCLNARDLGGMPTADGRRIRPGALVRSDRHSRLTPDSVAAIRSNGVAAIVDLRTVAECAMEPSPFAGAAFYTNIDWHDSIPDKDRDGTLAELYQARLDRHSHKITHAIRTLAEAPEGGLIVHCAVGKDRTGIVVALLLDLVGVDRGLIAADYAVSHGRLRASFAEELARLAPGVRRDRVEVLQSSPPETMLATLDHLHERYGGAAGYLRRHGLTEAHLDALVTRLVEPATDG